MMLNKLLQYVQIIRRKGSFEPFSQIKDGGFQIILPVKMGKLLEKDAIYHELSHIYRGDLFKFNNDLILEDYNEPTKSLLYGKLPVIYDAIIDHALHDQDDCYRIKTIISHNKTPLSDYTERELARLIAGYIQREIDQQEGVFQRSFTIPLTIDPDQRMEMLFDLEQTQNYYANGSHTESEITPEIREMEKILQELKGEVDLFQDNIDRERRVVQERSISGSIPRLLSLLRGDVNSDLYETSIICPSNINPERFSERSIEKPRVNVVFDVSGSMTDSIPYCLNLLKRVNTTINLIMVDDEVQSVQVIPAPFRGKIEIIGYGGTDLTPAFSIIKQKRWGYYPTLVITDGEFPRIKNPVRNRYWLFTSPDPHAFRVIPEREQVFIIDLKKGGA